VESWKGYCNSKSKGSVIAQISAQNREEVIMNRKYVMQLIDIIIYLSKQGISFRGHDEKKESLNQGNS